jgi:hypothetical protein
MPKSPTKNQKQKLLPSLEDRVSSTEIKLQDKVERCECEQPVFASEVDTNEKGHSPSATRLSSEIRMRILTKKKNTIARNKTRLICDRCGGHVYH